MAFQPHHMISSYGKVAEEVRAMGNRRTSLLLFSVQRGV